MSGVVLRESWVLAGRTVGHWRAQPVPFVVNLLFPVLVVLMMGGLFGGAVAGSTADYLVFVVPGVLALTMLFGIETTMHAVASDSARTITDRMRTLPISSYSVLGGRCLADLAASAIGLVVMTVAGFVLGWRWEAGPAAVAGAYALLMLLRVGLLWVGVYVGVKASGPEAVVAVQILVWPVGMLSTVFLDPVTMPRWLGWAAEWNPLSATATAVRELLGSPSVAGTTWASDHAVLLAVGWPLLLTLVFGWSAARAFRRG